MTSPKNDKNTRTTGRPTLNEVARLAGAKLVVLPSSVGQDVGVKDYLNLFDVIYGKLVPALKAAKK